MINQILKFARRASGHWWVVILKIFMCVEKKFGFKGLGERREFDHIELEIVFERHGKWEIAEF